MCLCNFLSSCVWMCMCVCSFGFFSLHIAFEFEFGFAHAASGLVLCVSSHLNHFENWIPSPSSFCCDQCRNLGAQIFRFHVLKQRAKTVEIQWNSPLKPNPSPISVLLDLFCFYSFSNVILITEFDHLCNHKPHNMDIPGVFICSFFSTH